MRTRSTRASTRMHAHSVRLAAPAAVVGTLAAVLTVAPAEAETPANAAAKTGELHRLAVPTSAKPVGTIRAAAATRVQTYTVRAGDTVGAIAARHGLRTADVLAWNELTWRSVIYPGQKLRLSAASASAPPARPAATPTSARTHTVVRGDTVYGIAKKYKTSVAAITAANGLSGAATIYPGQKLRLDGNASVPASKPSAPATRPSTTPASGATHTVVRGETVYGIATKYKTSVAAIIAANGLKSSAVIYPGQKLRVGGKSAAPASKPSTAPAAPAAKPKTHKVAAGDTLFGIATKYGTTVSVLLSANGLSSGSIIYPGQTLRLTAPESSQRFASLDATQKAHAVHIIRIGRELGVSDRGIAIALATAMVESSMRNLDHGDRDSVGLFQQRPSQGWGTAAQLTDADRSIRLFYGGAKDPNGRTTRGLLDIAGWQSMSFTGAAQAVQISAYPDRYGQWEQQAQRWLATL
ncbi:LysM peptidoglycan-binding domain-containing protein [Microbacterium sp. H1-D42]|uniref:LysM peptidoglycan-binding domain-containing protein n=1 Tax=Microbacterium sp. H1-D42 TaxID=2925844 RepID=UPI001F534E5C|nr:LysM peptidoglycan-binding domain-containing protein [Microbacterium sp. H1-D42]UNK72106.1 LysM peptidoglycan-binding domain-containing protein [Microbacterium sp. H1-D42]